MTIRHIRVFLAVYRTLSMTRAAEELHMVQPAVTRSIQELERYYGVKLFERLGRRLYATDCARELYGYASHIDDTFGEMEKRLLNRDASGVLRVGATRTIGNCDLARIVSRFQAENPGLRVRVRIDNGAELERALLSDELDMALMEGAQAAPELAAQPYGGDRLTLIAPPDCALGDSVSLEEVLKYPLLMREEGSASRAVAERVLEAHGLAVEPAWESASTQALRAHMRNRGRGAQAHIQHSASSPQVHNARRAEVHGAVPRARGRLNRRAPEGPGDRRRAGRGRMAAGEGRVPAELKPYTAARATGTGNRPVAPAPNLSACQNLFGRPRYMDEPFKQYL